MIIEHKGKQYDLIHPLRFEEADAVFKLTRKYIEITEEMHEASSQTEYDSIYSKHVKALDDKHEMLKIALNRCLGLTDNQIKSMDYGEVTYLFNKILETTLILAKE